MLTALRNAYTYGSTPEYNTPQYTPIHNNAASATKKSQQRLLADGGALLHASRSRSHRGNCYSFPSYRGKQESKPVGNGTGPVDVLCSFTQAAQRLRTPGRSVAQFLLHLNIRERNTIVHVTRITTTAPPFGMLNVHTAAREKEKGRERGGWGGDPSRALGRFVLCLNAEA